MQYPGLVALPLLALVPLATCGSCTITSSTWSINGIHSDMEVHEVVLEEALTFEAGDTVDVATPFGAIEVTVADADFGVVATVKGYGDDEEEARQRAEAVRLVSERSGSTLSLRAANGDGSEIEKVGIAFVVRVPAGIAARADSSSGGVTLRGALGDIHAESGFGALAVEGARGDLRLDTSSGAVRVVDVEGGRAEIESGFGGLVLQRCAFEACTVKTQSGSVSLDDVRADTASIGSGFGALSLEHCAFVETCTLETSSGQVVVRNVTARSFEIDSGFGGVSLVDCRGDLDADTSSGSVSVSGHEGRRLRLHSGFGGLTAKGVFESVDLESSSGALSVTALPGSSVADGWRLASGFGSVRLSLPEDLACDVSLHTGFGKVSSDLPVKLSRGALDGQSDEAEGQLNGGGKRITLRSNSGSVRLTRL